MSAAVQQRFSAAGGLALQVIGAEFRRRITKLREALLEIVAERRNADEVRSGTRAVPLVSEGAGLGPLLLLKIPAAQPGERNQVDDLVLVERLYGRAQLLKRCIVPPVLQYVGLA